MSNRILQRKFPMGIKKKYCDSEKRLYCLPDEALLELKYSHFHISGDFNKIVVKMFFKNAFTR